MGEYYINNNNVGMRSVCRIMALIVGIAINFDYFSLGGMISLVSLILIIYFLSVVLYIGNLSVGKYYRKFFVPPFLYLLLLIVLNIVNANADSSQIIPISFIFCLILFVVVCLHLKKDPDASSYLISGVMIGGLIMSVLFIFGVGVEYESGRMTMFRSNSNNLGCLMCLTVAIIINNCILNDRYNLKAFRFLSLLFLVPIIRLILSTASRTAFFSLAFVLLAGFVLFKAKRKITKLIMLVAFAAAFSVGYNYLSEYESLYARLEMTIDERDLSGRDGRWEKLFPIALDHPFGVGQTGYAQYSQTIYSSKDINGYASPHNVPLEVLLYTGFVGLAIMMLFWIRIAKCAYEKYRYENNLLPGLLMIVIIAQMLFGQILIFRTAWIVFAYICSKKKQID